MKGTVLIHLDSIESYENSKSKTESLQKMINLISEEDYYIEIASKEFNSPEGIKKVTDFLEENNIKVDRLTYQDLKGYMLINSDTILLNETAKPLLNKIIDTIDEENKNKYKKPIYIIDINTIGEGMRNNV